MALLNFDARTVKPDEGRTGPVPTGWYEAILVESEMKPNSGGTGEFLKLVFDIVTNGPFKGSKLFHQLNLRNPSEKAVQIAYGQLSAIAHAVNVLDVRDSADLHNKVLKVHVKLIPKDGDYEAKNEIKAFADVRKETPPSPTKHEEVVAAPPAPGKQAAWNPGASAPAAPANAAPWAQQNQQPPGQPPQPPAQAPWNTAAGGQPQPPQGYQQPQQPPAQPPAQAPAPAWQPPAGAQPQPWAQPPAQQAQAPAAAPMQAPAPTPQPWTPPPAQGGGQVPPWAQQPQQPPQ